MAYQHTNSKGVTYYLKTTDVTLRGGKVIPLYFFAKDPETSKGVVCDVPETKEVAENKNNGFLMLRNKVAE